MNRALSVTLAALAVAALVGSPLAANATTPAATTAATPLTSTALSTMSNKSLFAGGLYVQPDSVAATAATALAAQGDWAGASSASYIAKRPVAIWLGEWFQGDALVSYLNKNLAAAQASGKTAVFVTYAIPDRDCGGYSGGGLTNDTYPAWNALIAKTLAGHKAIVLVEPDSLGQTTDCADPIVAQRIPLIKQAVQTFAANGVPAYLDGGNSRWLSPATVAGLLNQAGVASARGFFTDVSNFVNVDQERAYADRISALTGGSHYVIDVSRNGKGWLGTWCNPIGAGLGQDPHVTAGTGKLDALLWVKTPGSSDGYCNGGPAAGTWFPSYAEALVANKK